MANETHVAHLVFKIFNHKILTKATKINEVISAKKYIDNTETGGIFSTVSFNLCPENGLETDNQKNKTNVDVT